MTSLSSCTTQHDFELQLPTVRSPSIDDHSVHDGSEDMGDRMKSLGWLSAQQFIGLHDCAGDGDTHRVGVLEPTPNRSPASSSTAVSCSQAVMLVGDGSHKFGVLPVHNTPTKRTPRELQESNPLVAPRKIEQIIISSKHEPYNIPAFNTLDFPHRVCPPEHIQANPEKRGGWRSALHPDGSLYFHKTSQSEFGSFNMITEAYLYGEGILHEVNLFTEYMWQHMLPARDKFANRGFELVMNVKVDPDTDSIVWSYYFIDHIQCMPFWMRDYNPGVHMRTTEELGASSPDHLRHLLKAMYWDHCALYPGHSGARCAAESIIAPIRYTAPYTAEEAVRLHEQLEFLRKYCEVDPGPYIEIAGRTISSIERWRYNFLHGTQVIRRFRGQTVLPLRPPSALYRVLAPAFFYAPFSHLYECRSVYLDGVLANDVEWTTYVMKLLKEWQEFVLYATILLNANLAFLEAPNLFGTSTSDSSSVSMDAVAGSYQPVSPGAILSFCSMLASFGSMMTGLLLIRMHRGEEIVDNPRSNKAVFIEKCRSARFEFEPLSILYSLPSSWPARASTIAGLIGIAVLAIWCIRIGWGSSLSRDFFRDRKHSKYVSADTMRLVLWFAPATRLSAALNYLRSRRASKHTTTV
ncbi:hypothetical protein PENSPDRAFT_456871 [Peniophora sp. CONT]|nr:hypothetical protein PENSPDRAFT_456871 [Peniophora sp. CONT]